jgi:hypothetical protein
VKVVTEGLVYFFFLFCFVLFFFGSFVYIAVGTGHDKDGVTALLGVRGDGEVIAPCVVFKGNTIPKPNSSRIPPSSLTKTNPVLVRWTPKSFMNANLYSKVVPAMVENVAFSTDEIKVVIHDACSVRIPHFVLLFSRCF